MAGAQRIIPTKLHAPIQQPKVLDRPRLTARMAEAVRGRVTLVAADAGFGKSTMMARFLVASGLPAVWYRLDAGDSDPAMFAAYLLEGLRPHAPGKVLTGARRGLNLVTDWPVAAQFLSEVLPRVRRDLVIVLDDFHLLVSPTWAEGMTRWIDDLPPRIHLVILTRSRPDLPLARWRAQGVLSVIGAEDLRFTTAELRAFLVELHGLPLTDASLHVVAAKTEGWPAGIVLALHAAQTQGPTAAAQALAALSGSSREIYEYLAQEAFARQAPEARQFLLATSVLSRFTATFAEALLGTTGAQQTIDHLEHSHLFLVPLDSERRWYRYHHLFQEFLQRVGAERDPLWLRSIHFRAAGLWEARGELDEAVHHFVEAGHPADAARLLSGSVQELLAQGRFETLRHWLSEIPESLWPAAPRLFIIQANCEVAAGEDRAAIRWLETAWRHLRASGDLDGEAETLRILGHLSIWEGARDRLRTLAQDVAPRVETFPPAARARVLELLARAAEVEGDLPGAERRYRDALATAQASGVPHADTTPQRYLASLLGMMGRFAEAEVLFDEVIAGYRRIGGTHEEAHVRVNLALLLSSLGRHDEADQHLAAVAVAQPVVPCRVLHGNLLSARGMVAARRQLARPAESLLREALEPGRPSYRYLIDRVPAQIELSLLLASQEPEEARRLAAAALDVAARLGPFWHARALLAFGVVTQSAGTCAEAAGAFDILGLAHWQALALMIAAAIVNGAAEPLRPQVMATLRSLKTDETWGFLLAQAGPARLALYRDDPEAGPRIARVLALAPAEPPLQLTVQCLGRFEVIRGGVTLGADAWPRSAPRRLLQYLVLQTRPVHREEIMEVLWPDLEPRGAANQLRVALSQLRHVLEPDLLPGQPSSVVQTAGSTVALVRERFDLDVDRFRRAVSWAAQSQGEARRSALQEAVDLYRSDLFADSPYEEWVVPQRDRLARQYVEALATLAEEEESAGRWQDALSRWAAVLEWEPAAEHAYRGMMRCYRALGRAVDALRAFEQCRSALADLGLTPAPETLRLQAQITGAPR